MPELNTHGFSPDAPAPTSRCRVCGQGPKAPVHAPVTSRAVPDAVGVLASTAGAGRESLIKFVEAVKEKL
ncbi:hypothetical protein [Mycolicibacterium conceptionense]|uniref:hypothetical protein n=1 Tax=Mycolicibacterium conceptionense TaxID=451644 RepID=UPI000AA36CDB|nr:hypothetical protein [Mycolicibacterium conceptionense]